jgi:hypothetical protein
LEDKLRFVPRNIVPFSAVPTNLSESHEIKIA